MKQRQTLLPLIEQAQQAGARLLKDIAGMKGDVKRMKQQLQVTQQLATFKAWIKASKLEARATQRDMRDRDDFPAF